MDITPLLSYEGMKQKTIPCIYYLHIIGIPFTIGILYALIVMGKDCSNLRTWLWVELIVQSAITAASIGQISKRFISKSGYLAKIPFLLLSLFQIAWLILGSIWILTETSCFDTFPEGYIMTATVSIVGYAAILVIILLYFITFIIETRNKKK